ncbi:MAG: 30S ribosomal protein S3 [Planctomycetota bacterium]|jgi:small subunit ribosomal protein S3|nr:30S ribosomal protein S3 [Planctomycetales bacterium]RLT04767.1 MAG: 30S ribosomal protein S3 [Planctomycetota bacterium]
MGQKVRPTGFRVGVMETWRSRWYASKREFGDLLLEDQKIRKFVATKYAFAEIARVEIERTRDQVVVHMHTARPGVIIGRKGQEVDKLKSELEELTGRRMDVKIVEITNPNRNAKLVAMKIAQQLQKRGSFRRAIKKTLDEVMSSGVYGVKIQMSGRLGGAEMSRQEKASRGSIPLSTLRRHIDYGLAESATTMGIIGVKVWIDLGDYSNEETADGVNAKAGQASKKPKRTYKR